MGKFKIQTLHGALPTGVAKDKTILLWGEILSCAHIAGFQPPDCDLLVLDGPMPKFSSIAINPFLLYGNLVCLI